MAIYLDSDGWQGEEMNTVHYVGGSFVAEQDANLSALDLGLLRGYGVFDYVQVYAGRPFHLMDHLKRLQWSAAQIQLEVPVELNKLRDITLSLIQHNRPIDAGIRFLITGGMSINDQLIPCTPSTLILLFHPYTPYPPSCYEQGMRAITTRTLRFLPEVKSTNYMPAIFAMKKAKAAGVDDALYVNENDEILEGTTCNVFFFKHDTLITSDTEIVRGVTRDIFLKLAKDDFTVEYRALKVGELGLCDEAFLTSSVKDGVPLVQIDDKIIGEGRPGPRTTQLRSRFRQYLADYLTQKPTTLVAHNLED